MRELSDNEVVEETVELLVNSGGERVEVSE
jgi:hypothetical protein